MKNKKILLASRTFYPAWAYGWIARVMYELSLALCSSGYRVDCISTDVLDDTKRNNVNHTLLENWSNIYYFKNISNILAYRFKLPIPLWLWTWLNENITNYDIVHIGDLRNIFNFYIYTYCKKYSIPYIISPFWTAWARKDILYPIKKLFDLIRVKDFLLSAKYITAQIDKEIEDVISLGVNKDKVALIPLMIDTSKIISDSDYLNIREHHSLPSDATIFLFVWRIHEYKATKHMIHVFNMYNKKHNNSYLYVVWRDDGYEDTLKKLSKELEMDKHIIFCWAVYHPSVISYYQQADVFILLASHVEWTSTASLEALACGTPVITNWNAGIPYLEEYKAWCHIEESEQHIIDQIENIIRTSHSDDCKKLIKDVFVIDSVKDKFIDIYFD